MAASSGTGGGPLPGTEGGVEVGIDEAEVGGPPPGGCRAGVEGALLGVTSPSLRPSSKRRLSSPLLPDGESLPGVPGGPGIFFCPNFFHNRTSVKLPYHIRNSWPGRAPLEFPKYVIIFGPQLFFKKLTFKMYVLSSSLNCMAKLWLDKSRLTFASVVRRSAMPNLLLIPKLRLVR